MAGYAYDPLLIFRRAGFGRRSQRKVAAVACYCEGHEIGQHDLPPDKAGAAPVGIAVIDQVEDRPTNIATATERRSEGREKVTRNASDLLFEGI